MNTEEFAKAVESQTKIGDRQLFVEPRSDTGQVFVTLINLPKKYGSSGAEAMNNRFAASIRVGKEKAKAETLVPLHDAEGKRIVLRGKTGKSEAVAKYVADFISKLVKEREPRYTHSKVESVKDSMISILEAVKDEPLPGYNVCEVLAGAYKESDPRSMLTHYEVPGTDDALCGRVRSGYLADEFAGDAGPLPTCPRCLQMARGMMKKGSKTPRGKRARTEAVDLMAEAMKLSGDLQIHEVEFASGQEPSFDDPDFATVVRVNFTIGGALLAKVSGKQQRVLAKYLENPSRIFVSDLENSRDLEMYLLPEVYKFVKKYAKEEGVTTTGLEGSVYSPSDYPNKAAANKQAGTVTGELEFEVDGRVK